MSGLWAVLLTSTHPCSVGWSLVLMGGERQ